MNEILKVTPAAAEHIKTLIAENKALGFRVGIKKTGCSGYKYLPTVVTEETNGDLKIKANKDLTIYLDPAAVEVLTGLTLDFALEENEAVLKKKRLVFINPNEKSRCGCGESFQV